METHELFDASATTQQKDNQALIPPRATDPGWAHGIMINGGRQKIKCKYCHKLILGGGISRLKQHLAGERGNVAPCDHVPEDVKVQMQQHLGFKVLKRLKREKRPRSSKSPLISYFQSREGGDHNNNAPQIQKLTSPQGTGKKRGKNIVEGTSSSQGEIHKKQNIEHAASVIPQPLQPTLASQDSMDQADMAVARFMYDAGLPFAAANSCYFQQMADAIAAVGPGYKMPSYHSLRGKLLNKCVQDVGMFCEELRKSWEVTGCSVLVDRCMDKAGHTVINFFVYCPKGTMFVKCFDVSDVSESSNELFDLFDSVVREVGQENIVNFVTDTSPSHKAAGQKLMEKYKTFFWSACGAHCIDSMLEEIAKMDLVKETLAKAKQVTQFLYNNAGVLNLMRETTSGRDIIQLSSTRFASIFQTLQRIVASKGPLHQMFTGASWMESTFSKQKAGLEVAEIMVDPLFWSMCEKTLKVTNPLLTVLHLMNCDERPSVGYIYDAIEKAKRNIIVAFDNRDSDSDCEQYIKIIDRIGEEEFYSPLHAAAYYLNPSMFYGPSFSSNRNVTLKGLLDCIAMLEPNVDGQVTISSQLDSYNKAAGDFGRPVALRGRDSLAPATWWSLYAVDFPELQRLAVRILSQTCSIFKCKRSWSMFECIHSKKINRVEQQRLHDLIFVHYNLHLQERRLESSRAKYLRASPDPICLEVMDANMGDWVEDPGALESGDMSWMDVMVPVERNPSIHEVEIKDDHNESSDD